jgi:hypothetical protein
MLVLISVRMWVPRTVDAPNRGCPEPNKGQAMRKFFIAVQISLFSCLAVYAVAKWPPPALAIPGGKDAVITVDISQMKRDKNNDLNTPIAGSYNYNNAWTLEQIQYKISWPVAGGGMANGPIGALSPPEGHPNGSLPTAPNFVAPHVLPGLPKGTVVTATGKVVLSKPNPNGGKLPPLQSGATGQGTTTVPPEADSPE